jgi:NADPH:quinone reductase-like Zn-dependent oxidoreductase
MTSQHAIYPSLRGKNVLITGGAEGIGAAAVELFALNGSQVIVLDISESSANTLITKITSLAKENSNSNPYFPPILIPIFHQIDVSDLPALQSLAKEILQKHKTIHILGYEPSSGDVPLSLIKSILTIFAVRLTPPFQKNFPSLASSLEHPANQVLIT